MSPRTVLWVIPAGFFGVFFLLPVVTLLITALGGATGQTVTQLASRSMLAVLLFTVTQAALSTVLTVVVALPGAAVLARFRFPLRGTVEALSPRELEVLRLIAQGLSNNEISQKLFLALNTVKGHNRIIFNKLHAQNRTEAVARARELGLL